MWGCRPSGAKPHTTKTHLLLPSDLTFFLFCCYCIYLKHQVLILHLQTSETTETLISFLNEARLAAQLQPDTNRWFWEWNPYTKLSLWMLWHTTVINPTNSCLIMSNRAWKPTHICCRLVVQSQRQREISTLRRLPWVKKMHQTTTVDSIKVKSNVSHTWAESFHRLKASHWIGLQ